MKLFTPNESKSGETRVAMSPGVVRKLSALGFQVIVEKGAGNSSLLPDSAFVEAGAITGNASDVKDADVVFRVGCPTPEEAHSYRKGTLVLAIMNPYGNQEKVMTMAKTHVMAFGMDLMPRITRAQGMDVLSSQASLAGYQAVIEAGAAYGRTLPMMITAAGTIPAARVFVMGAGVAGLQAIATARRLGAIVTASDIRPAAKEQVESLGARFIAVENSEFQQAETPDGYAQQTSKEYQARQAELITHHITRQDIVITTALVPGHSAPELISKKMIQGMLPGSVLVDLAIEQGGNIEGTAPGEIVQTGGVKIIGYLNMAGRIGATASPLYANNLYAFLETMVDRENHRLNVNQDDELIKATLLTKDGIIVHPAFTPGINHAVEGKKTYKSKNRVRTVEARGKADDLTRIKGIGPAIVKKLDKIGVNRFRQIAGWSPKDEREIGSQLAFSGRIIREKWVEQAKSLVKDGES